MWEAKVPHNTGLYVSFSREGRSVLSSSAAAKERRVPGGRLISLVKSLTGFLRLIDSEFHLWGRNIHGHSHPRGCCWSSVYWSDSIGGTVQQSCGEVLGRFGHTYDLVSCGACWLGHCMNWVMWLGAVLVIMGVCVTVVLYWDELFLGTSCNQSVWSLV